MLLCREPYSRLRSCDFFLSGELGSGGIVQIASHLNAEALESAFPDSGSSHCDICDDSSHASFCQRSEDSGHGIRFNEEERWTCRLQKALGDEYLVTEEGLSGRTTVFVDPIHESMDALSVIYALLKSHEVIDLLIIMLGTNDVKERFGANAACIAAGMERLILKAKSVDCWGTKQPNILVVAPPPIGAGFHDAVMGDGCVEKSAGVAGQLRIICERQGVHFLDAKDCEFNKVDFMHLTRKGHAQLAELLAKEVPGLI